MKLPNIHRAPTRREDRVSGTVYAVTPTELQTLKSHLHKPLDKCLRGCNIYRLLSGPDHVKSTLNGISFWLVFPSQGQALGCR